MNRTDTPVITPGMGTGTEQAPPLPAPWDPDMITALGMVGRVVSVPGTALMGVCLTVDGPSWQVVAGADGTAHVWAGRPLMDAYRPALAEVRWNRPVQGLRLLAVDLPDLARGVSLVKITDH